MDKKTMMRAELRGRFPIIWALQVNDPDSTIISMPLHSNYDLRYYPGDGSDCQYIEVKKRNIKSDIQTVMANKEKVASNATWGPDFFFVSTFTDDVAIWFQPETMPSSAITEGDVMIKKVQMDENSQKVLQHRLYYNRNDAWKIINVPHITIVDYDE